MFFKHFSLHFLTRTKFFIPTLPTLIFLMIEHVGTHTRIFSFSFARQAPKNFSTTLRWVSESDALITPSITCV